MKSKRINKVQFTNYVGDRVTIAIDQNKLAGEFEYVVSTKVVHVEHSSNSNKTFISTELELTSFELREYAEREFRFQRMVNDYRPSQFEYEIAYRDYPKGVK